MSQSAEPEPCDAATYLYLPFPNIAYNFNGLQIRQVRVKPEISKVYPSKGVLLNPPYSYFAFFYPFPLSLPPTRHAT